MSTRVPHTHLAGRGLTMPINDPRPPESDPPIVCNLSATRWILRSWYVDGTYSTTRHLGLEHELDHHHTGTVDSILLASLRGSTGFIEELLRSAWTHGLRVPWSLPWQLQTWPFRRSTLSASIKIESRERHVWNGIDVHHSACFRRIAGLACLDPR